jgi:hypothetical protein
MIITLISIAIVLLAFASVSNTLLLISLKRQLPTLKEGGLKLQEEKIKSDPFIEDIMHYAFKSNLHPMAMPDQNGKNTLFDTDEDGAYSICELFTVTNKQGSTGYNEMLKKVTERIDRYVENKIALKSKRQEKKDDTNK